MRAKPFRAGAAKARQHNAHFSLRKGAQRGDSSLRLFKIARVLPRFNYWLTGVPELPLVGLDLPGTLPPLTSFTGSKSRQTLAICPFFSRRQTDRIT